MEGALAVSSGNRASNTHPIFAIFFEELAKTTTKARNAGASLTQRQRGVYHRVNLDNVSLRRKLAMNAHLVAISSFAAVSTLNASPFAD